MPLEKNGRFFLTVNDLKPLVSSNSIIDGTKGGLILGNSHHTGGIPVIRQFNDEKLYEVFAEFEGWEYILNPIATNSQLEYLNEINSEFIGSNKIFKEYKIPKQITIIDARQFLSSTDTISKLILLDKFDQFIVNKHSTKKYLKQLERINQIM